jgi:N-acetylmuramoyl-L-alanine amidase
VIDPGHGGRDPGFHNGNKLEKQYTLLLAKEVRQQLLDAGFAASLTREGDTYPTLPERPEIARRRSADLFISLHWNSLPGNKAMKGAQTFCLTPAGARSSNGGGVIGQGASSGNRNNSRNVQLAYHIQRTLLKRLGVDDRGVRRARYWVLRDAIMPAVLIEGGFMSNPSESRNIFLPEYRKTMAAAIVEGIMSYRAHSH